MSLEEPVSMPPSDSGSSHYENVVPADIAGIRQRRQHRSAPLASRPPAQSQHAIANLSCTRGFLTWLCGIIIVIFVAMGCGITRWEQGYAISSQQASTTSSEQAFTTSSAGLAIRMLSEKWAPIHAAVRTAERNIPEDLFPHVTSHLVSLMVQAERVGSIMRSLDAHVERKYLSTLKQMVQGKHCRLVRLLEEENRHRLQICEEGRSELKNFRDHIRPVLAARDLQADELLERISRSEKALIKTSFWTRISPSERNEIDREYRLLGKYHNALQNSVDTLNAQTQLPVSSMIDLVTKHAEFLRYLSQTLQGWEPCQESDHERPLEGRNTLQKVENFEQDAIEALEQLTTNGLTRAELRKRYNDIPAGVRDHDQSYSPHTQPIPFQPTSAARLHRSSATDEDAASSLTLSDSTGLAPQGDPTHS